MKNRKVDIKNEEDNCPMQKASKLIGDFWSIMIVRELSDGCKRFKDLEDNIDSITTATLSSRLKDLDENNIISRRQYQCIPPKVEYTLTEKGTALLNVIKSIDTFGKEWM